MKLKKVVNIFGGPGSGKSTLSLDLCSMMKKSGMNVELVSEYAKQMVFEDRLNVLKEDQLYVLAKQHRKIFTLRDTVEYIITDSPFVQGVTYLADDSIYDRESFSKLALDTHNKYPSYNIFMIRPDSIPYEQVGRYQDEKQSKCQGDNIENFLNENNMSYQTYVTGSNFEKLLIKAITE